MDLRILNQYGHQNYMIGLKVMSMINQGFWCSETSLLWIMGESAAEESLYLVALVTGGIWHVTCHMSQLTCNSWHMTHDFPSFRVRDFPSLSFFVFLSSWQAVKMFQIHVWVDGRLFEEFFLPSWFMILVALFSSSGFIFLLLLIRSLRHELSSSRIFEMLQRGAEIFTECSLKRKSKTILKLPVWFKNYGIWQSGLI